MSISLFPRIYFKGSISWDPGLGNNFDFYDAVNVKLNVPPGTNLQQLREQLPLDMPQMGSWNHFGTHRAAFENVGVTGVSRAVGSIETSDPLVNKRLRMAGKLVDLNPSTDHGTQVFFDELRVGDGTAGFRAARNKRMYMRFLNFGRNLQLTGPRGAGAVWEVCFSKSKIDLLNPASSAVLGEIEAAFQTTAILGLAVRFHTYWTQYYQNGLQNSDPEQPRDPAQLRALYAQGKNFSNPAYSVVLGVITLWHEGELEGHPGGRFLGPVAQVPAINRGLGLTLVETDRGNGRVTLDFGETIPEANAALDKANIGTVRLVVNDAAQQTAIATIDPAQYARAAYESSAGLIDVDLSGVTANTWDAIERGTLSLEVGGQIVSSELEFVVAVEDRDIYLDEGGEVDLGISVTSRGQPAPAGTAVQVALYEGNETEPPLVDVVSTLKVGADGKAVLRISAERPSMRTYVFVGYAPAGPQPTPASNFSFAMRASAFHVNVRTLPFDNALAVNTPDSQLTWTWVYENILAVYGVINPVMARQLRPTIALPLHDRATMENSVGDIVDAIDKARFESASYMPVTRELSNGKRELLRRWCDLVASGNAPPDPGQPGALVVSTTDRRVKI
jgi:hypothetical protein